MPPRASGPFLCLPWMGSQGAYHQSRLGTAWHNGLVGPGVAQPVVEEGGRETDRERKAAGKRAGKRDHKGVLVA